MAGCSGIRLGLYFILSLLPLSGCSLYAQQGPPPDENQIIDVVALGGVADTQQEVAYVNSCASTAGPRTFSVPPRAIFDDPKYRWKTLPYTLSTDGENTGGVAVTLTTSLALRFPESDAATRDALKEKMNVVKDCMTNFFGKHGIRLDLSFNYTDAGPADVSIRTVGTRGATYNMTNWAFGINERSLSVTEACTTMTHEFGHLLGLKDEYPEEGLMNRIVGDANSIMRTAHCEPELVKFYSRHVKEILFPLCTAN